MRASTCGGRMFAISLLMAEFSIRKKMEREEISIASVDVFVLRTFM